jgi:hypothetical protein
MTLATVVLFGFSRIPREMTIVGNQKWKARYYGYGLHDGPGIFGKKYFAFSIDDLPFRTWKISYSGGEYGKALCLYPNGEKALEGECRIEVSRNQVYPITDDLRNAISYLPSGEISGRVIDGSGTAIWYYPDGTKNWECEYESGVRTRILQYAPDGAILFEARN